VKLFSIPEESDTVFDEESEYVIGFIIRGINGGLSSIFGGRYSCDLL
jgi:hypothetical protein